MRELQSILDYGRLNPSIDPIFGALSSFYWSSTSSAGGPGIAWVVYFSYGTIAHGDKQGDNYVRAVRSGP